jgi:hypothetical protein
MTTDITNNSVSSVHEDAHDNSEGGSESSHEHIRDRRWSINSESSYAPSNADEDHEHDNDSEDEEARKKREEEEQMSVLNVRAFTDEELKVMSPEDRKCAETCNTQLTASVGSEVQRIDWAQRKTDGTGSAAAGSSKQSYIATVKGSCGVDSARETGNGRSIFSDVKW